MKLQLARPAEHDELAELPWNDRLADWNMPNVQKVLGLHRHVVKLVEFPRQSYVVKELPDRLAEREYRLLRSIADDGLPTAEMVAVITDRVDDDGEPVDGMIVTKHLDYSLPYRTLLMGRGLQIPYLGDRMIDSLVVLLVRIHLAGYFWGDCSLSNTLFRRDAGALQAYIIDVETAEHHDRLSDGQRSFDLMVARDNVAGGLLDLQSAGRLAPGIDPIEIALVIEERYNSLWAELTGPSTVPLGDVQLLRERIDRLHELGFEVGEVEILADGNKPTMRYVPKVVEHGYHAQQLKTLTGLTAEENQARRMLNDIHAFGAEVQRLAGRTYPENVIAVRWLDQRFEPIIDAVPEELRDRLQPAEIYHQLLEHRWYMAERRGADVPLEEVLADYLRMLADAPTERLTMDDRQLAEGIDHTGQLPMLDLDREIDIDIDIDSDLDA